MTHREALRWLFSLQLFGVKLGLENIRALLESLGQPQQAFPSLLITGTNGKGSVAAMCSAVLRERGLRVGTYTSPHLVRFVERIAIDGRPIGPRRLSRLLGRIRQVIEERLAEGKLARHPTFFEVATAAGFLAFAEAGVDIAVIEVGLGGRFDATNTCEPLVSVLTTIALEHTRWLGGTVEAIAFEKAGVARAGRPFVIGVRSGPARRALEERARALGARLIVAPREVRGRLPRFRLPLLGAHQEHNLAVAVAALESLPASLRPSPAVLARGLARTVWPGRLERVPGRPPLLLDGAHNPHAALALRRHLRLAERGKKLVLVFACLGDKDVRAIVKLLFPCADEVVITRVANPRALEPAAIAALAPRGVRWRIEADPGQALALARQLAGRAGLVVVTGSLYLVGEVAAMIAGVAPPDQG